MESNKESTLDDFLNCFKGIVFEITSKKKKQPQSVESAVSHLEKMLSRAKKELARAKKGHLAGKLSIEEVQDHEYYVFEIKEEIKKIIESGNDLED